MVQRCRCSNTLTHTHAPLFPLFLLTYPPPPVWSLLAQMRVDAARVMLLLAPMNLW